VGVGFQVLDDSRPTGVGNLHAAAFVEPEGAVDAEKGKPQGGGGQNRNGGKP
jgi:hypothetical protein